MSKKGISQFDYDDGDFMDSSFCNEAELDCNTGIYFCKREYCECYCMTLSDVPDGKRCHQLRTQYEGSMNWQKRFSR